MASFTAESPQVLRLLPRVGLSVVSENHRAVVSDSSANGDDKFVSVAWRSSEAGAVYIDGAARDITNRIPRQHIHSTDAGLGIET